MTTQTSGGASVSGTRTKALLAAGLLLTTMMIAASMAAGSARAATTFTVNSTADAPDASTASNTCDTDVFTNGDQCTLRAAIQQANATFGADTINFAIPGTGVKTIAVGATGLGALPAITEQVSINGYTQPGSTPNTRAVGNDAVLKVELAGNGQTGTALDISNTSGSVIKGLVINRFGEGIQIIGNSGANRIEGNFIGTDPSGTLDRGNTDDGVNIFDGASRNVVGGTTPAARNVISGNACNAVFVSGANDNLIQGNYVGTDKTGTKGLPNGDGDGAFVCAAVVITGNSSGNTVGGATAGTRNLISGNKSDGVGILGGTGNKVLGNRIGTTASGTGALGNGEAGVLLQGSTNPVGDGTSSGSNTIAFNAEDGVQVQSGTGHQISRNSVFSNTGLGIDLQGGFEDAAGNTANDPGDIDSGPNGLQNKPVISSAKNSSTKTTVTGTLKGGREVTYLVQFFSNPSGTNEGRKFLGQKSVTTGADGKATFTYSPSTKVAVGQTITATATLLRESNTSEFSVPRTVASS